MALKLLILATLMISFSAMGKELSISIEHPKKERGEAVVNEIKCAASCDWKSSDKTKKSSSGIIESSDVPASIEKLSTLEIPVAEKISARDLYVKVSIKNEGKSSSFELGFPHVYKGAELEKFNRVNELIRRIEFSVNSAKRKK